MMLSRMPVSQRRSSSARTGGTAPSMSPKPGPMTRDLTAVPFTTPPLVRHRTRETAAHPFRRSIRGRPSVAGSISKLLTVFVKIIGAANSGREVRLVGTVGTDHPNVRDARNVITVAGERDPGAVRRPGRLVFVDVRSAGEVNLVRAVGVHHPKIGAELSARQLRCRTRHSHLQSHRADVTDACCCQQPKSCFNGANKNIRRRPFRPMFLSRRSWKLFPEIHLTKRAGMLRLG